MLTDSESQLRGLGEVLLGSRDGLERSLAGHEDAKLLELSHRMGFAPAPNETLFAGLPEDRKSLAQRIFMEQFARRATLAGQVAELAGACRETGLRVIALKGAIAARLYPPHLPRISGDLDLLVRDVDADGLLALLGELGYRPAPAKAGQGDAVVQDRLRHFHPWMREGALKVEVHLRFLHGRSDGEAAVGDAWREAEPFAEAGEGLWRLSPAHFLLHTAAHYLHHLRGSGGGLKSLVDLRLLIQQRGGEIDWPGVWRTAERWRICDDVARVLATLNEYWELGVPLPERCPAPLPAAVVLMEERWSEEDAGAARARWYASRVAAVRGIPGARARAAYLFRLAFPSPAVLRRKCGIPEGRSVAPFYVRYPATRLTRFVSGLRPTGRR